MKLSSSTQALSFDRYIAAGAIIVERDTYFCDLCSNDIQKSIWVHKKSDSAYRDKIVIDSHMGSQHFKFREYVRQQIEEKVEHQEKLKNVLEAVVR